MKTLEQIIGPFHKMSGVEREAMVQEITEHPDGPAYWAILATYCSYPLVPELIHTCADELGSAFIEMCMTSALVRLKACRDAEKRIDLQMREENHER